MSAEFTVWHAFAVSGTIIVTLLGVIAALLGIVYHYLQDRITALHQAITALQASLPSEYIREQQFNALQYQVTKLDGQMEAFRATFHEGMGRIATLVTKQ